jgi:hypothetical protein
MFASLVILFGMHLSLATHFCEGRVFASKISFTGEKASCGMESNKCPIHQNQVASDCCKDQIANLSVDNEYSPSSTQIKDITRNILHTIYTPERIALFSLFHSNTLLTHVHSKDVGMAKSVSLTDICILQI